MAVQSMQEPVGVAVPLLPGEPLNTACTTQHCPYIAMLIFRVLGYTLNSKCLQSLMGAIPYGCCQATRRLVSHAAALHKQTLLIRLIYTYDI